MTQINITNESISQSLSEAPTGVAYYRTLRRFQRAFAEEAMKRSGGNQSKAADEMGINRASLRQYLKHEV